MKGKVYLAALALCGLLASAVPAQAAGTVGVYVAPRLVFGLQSVSDIAAKGYATGQSLSGGYKGTWGIGLAGGYDFNTQYAMPIRAELELMHAGEAKHTGNSESLFGAGRYPYSQTNSANSLFVNAYYDVHTGTMFTPYLGLGLGPSWVTSKGSVAGHGAENNTETNLGWNVGAGVGAELTSNASIDVGYRYVRYGDARTGLTSQGYYLDSTMAMHQLTMGLRYTF